MLGLLLVLVCCAPRRADAQDSQYWSFQYGPVGQILAGQVVGSTRDLSASYYNPGGLALARELDFLLSVQAFRLQSVRAESFSLDPTQGPGRLETSDLSIDRFPGFVAFALPASWLGPDTRLAVSLLTRQQFNAHVGQRSAVNDSSGAAYGAEALFDQRMSENWGGLTISHRLSDGLGLGATVFGVYRGQRTRWEQSAQLRLAGQAPRSALAVDDFDYYHTRLLVKTGLAWETDQVRLGLNVTSPSVALFGDGNVGFTRSVSGAADGHDLLEQGLVEDVPSYYRSNWAVALGGAWRRDSLQLHASGEWFAPVGRFTVLEGPPTPAGSQPADVFEDFGSVLNLGLGVEYWLGGAHVDRQGLQGATVLYAAIATDNSASPDAFRGEASSSDRDWTHISGGVGFSLAANRFTVGVDYAFGSGNTFSVPSLGLTTPTEGRRVVTRSSRWVVMLGYLFGK